LLNLGSEAGNPQNVYMQQIKVQQDHDLVDEEVGMLTDAVVKLKGMVQQIGVEAEETGANLVACLRNIPMA
jgi:hypothetical protein